MTELLNEIKVSRIESAAAAGTTTLTTDPVDMQNWDGVVFVADSQWDRMKDNVESFRNLEENLAEYNYDLDGIPYVLQYNKRDLPDAANTDFMEFVLNNRPQRQLSYQSIATEGGGVFETLNGVCKLVLRSLQEKHGAGERAPGQATLA